MKKKIEGWIFSKVPRNKILKEQYSALRFHEVAKEKGIKLRILDPENLDLVISKTDQKVFIKGKEAKLPDFVIPKMGAKITYFSLAVVRQLEKMGVYCLNSSEAIEKVKDKLHTQQILAANHFPVPKTMLVKSPVDVDLVEKELGFPVVIKTTSGSQGSGVYLSSNKTSFNDLMGLIEQTKTKRNIILQQFISPSKGRDLRVFVIGGKAVACMERSSATESFKANFSKGGSVKKFEITPEIEWLAIESSRILGLDVAGIDLLFDEDGFKVCEANYSPGFKGLEKACDINIAEEIYHFIQIRLGL